MLEEASNRVLRIYRSMREEWHEDDEIIKSLHEQGVNTHFLDAAPGSALKRGDVVASKVSYYEHGVIAGVDR